MSANVGEILERGNSLEADSDASEETARGAPPEPPPKQDKLVPAAGGAVLGGEIAEGRRLQSNRQQYSHLLPTVVQPEQLLCKDEPFAELDFMRSEIAHSNLGNMGPDKDGPEGLHFRSVATVGREKVDLLVSTEDGSGLGLPERNGKCSASGLININGSEPVQLRFQFVSADSGKPVTLSKVFFTLFDLVSEDSSSLQVDVGAAAEYFALDTTRLGVRESDGVASDEGCRYSIRGRGREVSASVEESDSKSVKEMWQESMNSSLLLVFKGQSEFTLTTRGVKPSPRGFDLEFTGMSEVMEMGVKTECSATRPVFQRKFRASESARQAAGSLARRQRRDWRTGAAHGIGFAALAVASVAISRAARRTLSGRAGYGFLHPC
jgi:hypothetical protein